MTVSGLTLTGQRRHQLHAHPAGGLDGQHHGAAVTVSSGLTANNKVYDGTTTATLTASTIVLTGVAAGDAGNVSLSTNGYTAAFASAAADNGKSVTVERPDADRQRGGRLHADPAHALGQHHDGPRDGDSGVTANNKVYDATTAATLTTNNVVLSGVLAGDSANVKLSTNGYTAAFASANVGAGIGVTVSGLSLSGQRLHQLHPHPTRRPDRQHYYRLGHDQLRRQRQQQGLRRNDRGYPQHQ